MNEPAAPEITVDDLKRRAIHIKDMAEVEVRQLAEEQVTKVIVIGAVALVAALTFAYYLGSRRRL